MYPRANQFPQSLQNNIHVSKVHCGSAFEPGASRLPYYCTPPVTVPAIIGARAVWRQNTKQKKGHRVQDSQTNKQILCTCVSARVCMSVRAYVYVRTCHASVCVHVCVCVSACMCACECLHPSLLPTIFSQEPDKRHGLSPKTLGFFSCLFESGRCWLHTMMFETSTYMSVCMSICMCVCSGACLHRCMYMSRTYNTYIHSHTHAHTYTHTPLMNFSHGSSSTESLSKLG